MTHELRFHRAASHDLANALDYYDQISSELATRFRNNANKKFDSIVEQPESFPLDVLQIRYAKIKRFPYLIFFIVKPKYVLVLAVVHGASNPETWRIRG